jgi:hypothetical protein
VSHAKNWQENMERNLKAEKTRYYGEGEDKWMVPDVILSFVKYERITRNLG